VRQLISGVLCGMDYDYILDNAKLSRREVNFEKRALQTNEINELVLVPRHDFDARLAEYLEKKLLT